MAWTNSVAEPSSTKTSEHIGCVVERKERLRCHRETLGQLHYLLVIQVQGKTRREACKREGVNGESKWVVPDAWQPLPAAFTVCDDLACPTLATCLMCGAWYAQRKDQHSHEVQRCHRCEDSRDGHLEWWSHEIKSTDQNTIDTQRDAEDGNALGATSQRCQAGQQVGLKGPHGGATKRVSKNHPVKTVAFQCEDNNSHHQHGQHHEAQRNQHPDSWVKVGENYLVANPEDEAKKIQARHGCTKAVRGV
mmetsp:Transcript_26589/g.63402  ORF Transcript_26589/g.63402 Transcript_26589/m.63402 type:complete len:249 (-) Transcript_26589:352-1098(-)